jgi:putative tricarboxylic transport membrane protein
MHNTSESERLAPASRFARDFLVGVAILVFCAAAYWASLDIKQAPAALAQNVQPATFPRLVIALIAVLTLLMMALGATQRDRKRRAPKAVMLITGISMICFVFAFEFLGLPLAIGLFCLVMPLMWGARPSWALVAYAIAFPAMVYLIFVVGLDVYIQPGIISQLVKSVI